MDYLQRKKELKIIGLYIVVILALLRIVVFPLHGALTVKRNAFHEYYDSYILKYRLFERSKAQEKNKPATDMKMLFQDHYLKDVRFSTIQVDVVETLIKLAENKGIIVLDFEMLEPVLGKNVSEISVLIRLEGKVLNFNEVLKSIEQGEKALHVKSLEINNAAGQDMRYFLTVTAFRVER